MTPSRLVTLGTFSLQVAEQRLSALSTQKARALLAYLVLNQGLDIGRERLLELFWPDADPERSRDSLRTALWSIRRSFREAGFDADAFVFANKSIIRWIAPTACDLAEFSSLAAGDAAFQTQAIALYGGDFLEGDYDEWIVEERERAASVYEALLARIVRDTKNVEAAQRLLSRNPYDENAYTSLIESELAGGRRFAAAALVDRCRLALADVGDEPSPAFESRFSTLTPEEPEPSKNLRLPFAGREPELAALQGSFDVVRGGQGAIVLVYGEAGIGKSSLLARATTLAQDAGLTVVNVRAVEADSRAFGPWPELFEALTLQGFAAFIKAQDTGAAGGAIGSALGDALRPKSALFVDDAHALGGESLEVLRAIAESAAISGSAVVIASRPEGLPALRKVLMGSSVAFEELSLEGLGRDDVRAALEQVGVEQRADLADALHARSGGHPYFIAGLLDALRSSGSLQRDGRRWRLARALDASLPLPSSLKHYIESRLLSRGKDAASVACALAVERFATADDLTAVLALDESRTFDAIDDLLALGLIVQPVLGPEFAFTHDLVREVAAKLLNAGRRARLHRGFAQRLAGSTEHDSSLRRARHLRDCHETLAAGESYVRAAWESLEWHATQDSIDRCLEGVAAVERSERSADRDTCLAELYRVMAEATAAGGDPESALEPADRAVAFARQGGDATVLTYALLVRGFANGISYRVAEQRGDAMEAETVSRRAANEQLLAKALMQRSKAALMLGLGEESLQAACESRDCALRSGESGVAVEVLDSLLKSQLTWWHFSDAVETAALIVEEARRSEPSLEASLRHSRASLWYILERYDEADLELESALRILRDPANRQEVVGRSGYPTPLLYFAVNYMLGSVAAARSSWDEALEQTDLLSADARIAQLPVTGQALKMLRIDALLGRNGLGDAKAAQALGSALRDHALAQCNPGWSDCPELSRARIAARLGDPSASERLTLALDAVEKNARRTPLEADRAFAKLSAAAAEAGAQTIATRARARSEHYRARRIAAAGTYWGGQRVAVRS